MTRQDAAELLRNAIEIRQLTHSQDVDASKERSDILLEALQIAVMALEHENS